MIETGARGTRVSDFPKVIWTFWDSPGGNRDHYNEGKFVDPDEGANEPARLDQEGFVRLCVDSFRLCNPDWTVHVLNCENVGQFLSLDGSDGIPDLDLFWGKGGFPVCFQNLTDMIRVALLHKYGGFWIDASSILLRPMEALIQAAEKAHSETSSERRELDYIGYEQAVYRIEESALRGYPVRMPYVESWFMASLPGTPFMLRLRDVLAEYLFRALDPKERFDLESVYLEVQGSIGRKHTNFHLDSDVAAYLWIHAAIQRVIHESNYSFMKRMFLFDASRDALHFSNCARSNEFVSGSLLDLAKGDASREVVALPVNGDEDGQPRAVSRLSLDSAYAYCLTSRSPDVLACLTPPRLMDEGSLIKFTGSDRREIVKAIHRRQLLGLEDSVDSSRNTDEATKESRLFQALEGTPLHAYLKINRRTGGKSTPLA